MNAYHWLVPSEVRITLVLNWSMLPLVIPVFALKMVENMLLYVRALVFVENLV